MEGVGRAKEGEGVAGPVVRRSEEEPRVPTIAPEGVIVDGDADDLPFDRT